MKRILELVRPHWRLMAFAAFCSLVVSALNGSFAWLVKPTVDNVFVKGQGKYISLIAVSVVVIFIVRGIFEYFQNYIMRSIGARIVRDLRNKLYEHMLYLPIGRYGRDTTGSLMSRIINDTQMLNELLTYRVRDLFVSSGTIVFLAGVALWRKWDLTVLTLVMLSASLFAVGKLGRRLKRVSERAQCRIASITEMLSETLSGIKIVKSFNAEERETGKFKGKNMDYYRESMRSARIIESSTLVMEFVAGMTVAFIIFYGGRLVASGSITAGDFFSFLAAILMIYTPAKRLAQVNNGLQQASAFVGRADEVLNSNTEEYDGAGAGEFKESIEFKGVSFRHSGREEDALSGVDLKIHKGETLALVGESGSGKTTLADLLSRFYTPSEGKILIDGRNINELNLKSLRSLIGIVSQDIVLFNDSVKANISYGMDDVSDDRVLVAAKSAYAHEFITELPKGYDTSIGESGALLSGGQKQRISIARAILKNPPVLILDEATSSLDSRSELMVQRALDDLMAAARQQGGGTDMRGSTTLIIIAHRLSTIRRADRIIVLDKGRVVEEGSHEDLLKANGPYSKFYRLQEGVDRTSGDKSA